MAALAMGKATDTRMARRDAILDAAFALLREKGYRDTTMLAVARRAKASKETLYNWFGDKEGLFAALIEREADQIAGSLTMAMDRGETFQQALVAFGAKLFQALTGQISLTINRAAIAEAAASPQFGRLLRAKGREQTGQRVIAWLHMAKSAGQIDFDNAETAFSIYLGLLLRDDQMRVLLGGEPPSRAAIAERADAAAKAFTKLYRP